MLNQLCFVFAVNFITMQFGKIGMNEFTLDYQPPLHGLEAFGIMLTCFACKLGYD
jgi:hypothetical protein